MDVGLEQVEAGRNSAEVLFFKSQIAKYYSSKTSNNSVAYLNGKVYTVDKSQPWVFDFIVSTAGTFDVVGTTDEILSIAKVRSLVTCDLR